MHASSSWIVSSYSNTLKFTSGSSVLRYQNQLRFYFSLPVSFIVPTSDQSVSNTPEDVFDLDFNPTRQNLHRCGDYSYERDMYMKILRRYLSGEKMCYAFRNAKVTKTTFYNRRFIVELMEVDPVLLRELAKSEKSASELNRVCKERLSKPPLCQKLSRLKSSGKLLP